VNWREFHAGAIQVLVKHIDGVGLVDRHHFIFGKAIS
jgi:phosphoribosyl-dephospho-CoA transferase